MTRKTGIKSDPCWYKDAIIYELHVKSFADSNGDGIGDFRGLIGRLPYLKSLGITAVWLLPFYPSPLRDDGYDISDYCSINPEYGDISDFREFLRKAHELGLRVITELVVNHTSDQHPWFQKARAAKPGSSRRNYYVWSDNPEKYSDARVIFSDFETSNWAWDPVARSYYWHRFYSHQPDLNFENPRVQKEITRVIDFWFETGVDGMRMDAVPYLYEEEGTNCENLSKTHAFLKKLRAHVDSKYKDKMFLCEANQWPEDVVEYFGKGDECHMAYHFPLMPRLFMSLWMEETFPIVEILEQTPSIPENCQWAIFLRNHDELTLEMVTEEERDYMYKVYARDLKSRVNMGIRRRLAPLLDNNRRKIELMNMLLLSLPGAPVIYYGDEIGMGDNYYLGDRNGVRTPMQWSPDRNAGFSNANPHKLFLPVIIDPEYHYEATNVENQEKNPSSILWWMKRVLNLRKKIAAFGKGGFELVQNDNSKIFSFLRKCEDEVVLVVVNLSRFTQVVNLDLSGYAGRVPVEVFGGTEFPVIKQEPYMITPGFHHCYWFVLRKMETGEPASPEGVARLATPFESLRALLGEEEIPSLEKYLAGYLVKRRWFGGKARKIREIKILDVLPVSGRENGARIFFLGVSYMDGHFETYVLPLAFMAEKEAEAVIKEHPDCAVLGAEVAGESGFLVDAVFDPAFRNDFFGMFSRGRVARRRTMDILPKRGRKFKSFAGGRKEAPESKVLKAEQSNTSLVYGGSYFAKLFRKIEEGVNPDAEIGEFLTEKTRFENTPSFLASLSLRKAGKFYGHVGILQEFVHNQGDAWSFTLDELTRFYEKALARMEQIKLPKKTSLFDLDPKTLNGGLKEVLGETYMGLASLLGKRTAQMHSALAARTDSKDFVPENFSRLYQRSVYQSMTGYLKKTVMTASARLKTLPGEAQEEMKYLVENKGRIMKIYSEILNARFQARKIRIHGDYHLGQVLFTGKDFLIIDFEGEPARTLGERRIKRSCLRDVAGMLRSFHYGAYGAILLGRNYEAGNARNLQDWGEFWYSYMGKIFLDSYLKNVKNASLLSGDSKQVETLLRIFLTEKCLYEINYELNNRPGWIFIPLKGIKSILGD